MQFTPYTLAISDLAAIAVIICLVVAVLILFGDWVCEQFDPCARDFEEPADDAVFDSPHLEETGIACEIAKLPAGAQLVEIDTAGMLTPPGQVWVHEYRWTGSAVEFVRRVPLHEFSFTVSGAPRS